MPTPRMLQALGITTIFLWVIHRPRGCIPPETVMSALQLLERKFGGNKYSYDRAMFIRNHRFHRLREVKVARARSTPPLRPARSTYSVGLVHHCPCSVIQRPEEGCIVHRDGCSPDFGINVLRTQMLTLNARFAHAWTHTSLCTYSSTACIALTPAAHHPDDAVNFC
ncbi:hypothetical protein C8Q79DRAFT_564981 [Trametes meyenii]|nr:hypothetical protein C8Q79DRAFT_564981 [Trametes meyenii]